ncbi:MAG: hypothetical protein AB1847_02265 [bacterium]
MQIRSGDKAAMRRAYCQIESRFGSMATESNGECSDGSSLEKQKR